MRVQEIFEAKSFPMLKGTHYLDNAAMAQMSLEVQRKIQEFVSRGRANAGRSIYKLGVETTKEYERARRTVADFIGALPEEIVFTSGTTDSLNVLAKSLPKIIGDKEILLSEMEHHSNLIPWQKMAEENNLSLKFVPFADDFSIRLDDVEGMINSDTAVFSFCHASNVFGTINDAKRFCELARKHGAISVVDAAQTIAIEPIDVRTIGCDFLAFSAHKIGGPTGIGVLYGRKEILDSLSPVKFGGGMVNEVDYEGFSLNSGTKKFEAGTQNIEGAIGLAAAIEYIERIGIEKISSWNKELFDYALNALSKIDGISIYAGKENKGIISFNLEGIHPHDVAFLLDEKGICVRAGNHCCMPLMKKLKLNGTVRASFYYYNNYEDIDALVDRLMYVQGVFNKDG